MPQNSDPHVSPQSFNQNDFRIPEAGTMAVADTRLLREDLRQNSSLAVSSQYSPHEPRQLWNLAASKRIQDDLQTRADNKRAYLYSTITS